MVVSVRTRDYKIVALNVSAVSAADRLVDHMKANGLQLGDYVVIVGGKVMANVQQWIDSIA